VHEKWLNWIVIDIRWPHKTKQNYAYVLLSPRFEHEEILSKMILESLYMKHPSWGNTQKYINAFNHTQHTPF